MTIPGTKTNCRRRAEAADICLVLFVVVVWAFLPSLRNGFADYDDDLFVTSNRQVQSGLTWSSVGWAFRNPVAVNWHPLTILSHMLDCQLYGLKAWGHHLTNVLLHAANAVLLFLVFRRMTGAFWRCVVLAALFGLHPLRVESVAWVAERKDVLSTYFFLLTLWGYGRYAEKSVISNHRSVTSSQASGAPATDHGPRTMDHGVRIADHRSLFYLLSLFFFALGLMSKPMVVTLPVVLLLLDYWPLKRFEPGTQHAKLETLSPLIREKLPFFALAAVGSVVAFTVHAGAGNVRATGDYLFGARVENALVSYSRYLGKLFWPVNLSVSYPYPPGWPVEAVLLSGVLVLGISVLAVVIGRQRRYLPSGWFWFVGTLVPVIGLVQAGLQSMADRYSYVPSIGLFLMLVWGVHELSARWRYRTVALSVLAVAATFLCTALTRRQIGYWRNDETLWGHALAVTRVNALANFKLGYAFTMKHRPAEAIHHYNECLRLNPKDAEAHNNLGSILATQGRQEEAIQHFMEALRLNANYPDPHYNLGLALASRARFLEAAAQFREVIRLSPNHPSARQKLERALAAQQKLEQAADPYREVLRSNPVDARAHSELGRVLLEAGQVDEAIAHCAEAARLESKSAEARYQLGAALARKGEEEKAARQFGFALELDPKLAAAHYALGIVRQQQQRMSEALKHWREAARLAPQWADPLNNLAWALATDSQAERRDGAEAVELATRALELAGTNNVGVLDTLAAAHAEAGRFAEAASTARQAEAAAVAQGQAELAEQIRQRLVLYDGRQPYREKTGAK